MFDINKPHKRRDGGDFEIVAIKNGFAFGFYGSIPGVWVLIDNILQYFGSQCSNLDIVQLSEEKEVVGYHNIWDDRIGRTFDSLEARERNTTVMGIGIIKTTAKIIDGKLVSVKSEIVE